MFELMLLGIQYCDEGKKYLYAMELKKQKIIRIVKFDDSKSLSSVWKRGMITKAEDVAKWSKERNTYTTHGETLEDSPSRLCLKILSNKAASPEMSLFDSNNGNYGIIRISSLDRIEEGGHILYGKIWGWKDEIIRLKTSCESWLSFHQLSDENEIEQIKSVFGLNRRKIFALIKTEKDSPEIVDFYVV